MTELRDAARSACAEVGVCYRDVPADGAFHAADLEGDRHGRGDGRIKLFPDGEGGIVCNWKTGELRPFFTDDGRQLSADELRERELRRQQAKRQAGAEAAQQHAEVAAKAAAQWEAAKPADSSHPYLVRKGVQAHGLRQLGELLVVPVCDADGKMMSLQTIAADGAKRFLPGGKVAGGLFMIGKPDGRICVAEGFATAASIAEATGRAVAVAFNAGNLLAVAEALAAKFPGAELTVCADDDHRTAGNPGIAKATEAVRAVGGRLAVPDFGPDRPEGATDLNDLMRHRGRGAVAAAVTNAQPPAVLAEPPAEFDAPAAVERGGNGLLPTIWACDADAVLDGSYIVKSLIAAGELAVIYGPPKSGKTFIALDLVLHVATGMDWYGHRVRAGLVLYISAEMGRRVMRRVRAWQDEKLRDEVEPPRFVCVPQAVNLLDARAVERLTLTIAKLIAEHGAPSLVVIDTLARSMVGGDENSAQDMGRVVAVGDMLRDRFGAATVVIHHEGKAAAGARGSSALLGAADTMIHVTAGDDGTRIAEVEWCRDGAAGERIGFALRSVALGVDEDGDPVTTCVVDPLDAPPTTTRRKANRRDVALEALREAISEYGERMPGSSTIPAGVRATTLDRWKARWTLRTGYEESTGGSAAVNFSKDKSALLTSGAISISKPYVWVSE